MKVRDTANQGDGLKHRAHAGGWWEATQRDLEAR